jgi:hypothetical protein
MKPWVCVRGFNGREVFRILTGDRTLAITFLRFADARDTARWPFCKAAFWFLRWCWLPFTRRILPPASRPSSLSFIQALPFGGRTRGHGAQQHTRCGGLSFRVSAKCRIRQADPRSCCHHRPVSLGGPDGCRLPCRDQCPTRDRSLRGCQER